MTRDDVTDAIDSPTVTALAEIFASRTIRDKSYSSMIVDVLAPRLAAVAASRNAQGAAWWRWRFMTKGRWSAWLPLNADEVEAFRELQGHRIAEGGIELEPLFAAPAALPTADLLAATVSCSGKEIVIACEDHDVKDRLMDFLTGSSAPAPTGGPR